MKKSEIRKIIKEEIRNLLEIMVDFVCNECGNKFKRNVKTPFADTQCPKCKGYDVEPDF